MSGSGGSGARGGSGGAPALRRGLLYSQCWEDAAVARAALRIRPGDTVLAVAAAGDNVLALLQDDPGRIIAVDVNPAQTALVELKIGALRALPDAQAVQGFLGAAPSEDRAVVYRSLRDALGAEARDFWDANLPLLEQGVIHAGRFERYLGTFRRTVLRVVPGRATIRRMLAASTLDDQRRIYREQWDSTVWRLLFRVFFSQGLLRRFGRDPAFFEQCEIADIGGHYLARARHALTDLPIRCNPYLTYMLAGRFGDGDRIPDYLRPEVQALVRERLDGIAVRNTTVDEMLRQLPDGSVDAFYLSDIFELSTPEEHARTLDEIARVGRPGARICYWNNLVPRRRPDSLAGRLATHDDEAAALHATDRAFLYSRLVVESVRAVPV
jgi:S-adenosylmethionine-diacylglycerol 3-amino-3-carboxypropyl transferase